MKRAKRKILMDIEVFRKLDHLADIGVGNGGILNATGLTTSQISYRRAFIKRERGLKEGLWHRWQHGNHPLQATILRDYEGVMDLEFERMLRGFVHVTPKTVKQ